MSAWRRLRRLSLLTVALAVALAVRAAGAAGAGASWALSAIGVRIVDIRVSRHAVVGVAISVRSAVVCADCDVVLDGRLADCPRCGRETRAMAPVTTWLLAADATDSEILRRTRAVTGVRRRSRAAAEPVA